MDVGRVETERLVGRRPLARDADELHPVLADPRVAAWVSPGQGGWSLQQVRTLLVRDMDHWKRERFGPWLVRDRATRRVVGRIGLKRCVVGGADEVEVAWLVDADRWGEGLATEMARTALEVGLVDLALPSVVAFTLPDNGASRAVMDHLGMAFEREVEHAGLPHVLYRITLDRWKASPRPAR
jgi:ribosomal-protein-alanine N-acetyltransferase